MPARRVLVFVFAPLLALFVAGAACAQEKELGGQLTARVDGREIQLPLMHTDVSADVQGDLATVTVVQTFQNPTQVPLNATYLFPLNEDSAVFAMTMRVGDELVTAHIRRREEARREFEQARDEGRAASLLTQHRPNMFTQEVANLMPGQPVVVTLRYAQTVPRVDGAYELDVPLVVGPRYNPRPALVASNERPGEEQNPAAGANIGPLPAYPAGVFGLTLPDQIAPERVSIAVNLTSGLPIADVTSATHNVTVSGDASHRTVGLTAGRVIDNRDFVLRYRLAGGAVQAGVLSHADSRGGFFSLVVEPPRTPAPADITPREIVFVLDTSGSMEGEPIEASKAFMHRALETLRPGDYFRIVAFDSTPREYSDGPIPANAANLTNAQRFISSLTAQGGTELEPAVVQAFAAPQQPNTLRLVVFLSDGYIGDEAQVLNLLSARMGQARVYAFGVGTSVNRYLMSEMARRGRGIARYIDPTETSFEAAQAFAQRLDAPVLTDISVDWGNLHPLDVTPAVLPDLFAGDSLRLMGRFSGAHDGVVTIHGRINGRPASLPVRVHLSETSTDTGSPIPEVWARSQVSDLMRDFTSPPDLRTLRVSDADLQERVTQIGLNYALVTNWTSFVAVSQRIVNAHPGDAQNADVPLPMPEGVGPGAYGVETAQNAQPMNTGGGFNLFGSSAPEPNELALLGVLLLMLALSAAKPIAVRIRRR